MKKILSYFICSFSLVVAAQTQADITSHLHHYNEVNCELQERHAASQGRPHPHMSVAQGVSTNWSGYASATNLSQPVNNTVTTILGTWTVPTLKPTTGATTYTAIWVGIDGYGSGTVEQLGTEHDWVNGAQQDSAWFEMYPLPSYNISGFPLHQGDVIEAEVDYLGNNQFQLSMVNHTQKIKTIIPAKYTNSKVAKRSSAEWIVEAPYSSEILPLSDFQTISFTNCVAVIKGIKAGIESSHWQSEALNMQDTTGAVKAVTSALSSDYESFSVQWKHQ